MNLDLLEQGIIRSPAVARMADRTAPYCSRKTNPNPNIAGPARVRRHLGARHGSRMAIIWQKQALIP